VASSSSSVRVRLTTGGEPSTFQSYAIFSAGGGSGSVSASSWLSVDHVRERDRERARLVGSHVQLLSTSPSPLLATLVVRERSQIASRECDAGPRAHAPAAGRFT
jgi:hypothetical protein